MSNVKLFAGSGVVLLYALGTTGISAFVAFTYPLDRAYLALIPVVVVFTWVAAWAWTTQRWPLAALGLVVSVAAPWGYLYVAPLLALVLAAVAVVRWRRKRSKAVEESRAASAA